MKCLRCGYQPPKKPIGKPQKFTVEEKKQIIEDVSRKKMTLFATASKWNCSIGTIQNIIKSNLK